MLNPNEITDKLAQAPERFREFMEQEQYTLAKWWHYGCLVTADFIELDNAEMDRLFGEDGAFPPELVKKAYGQAGGGK